MKTVTQPNTTSKKSAKPKPFTLSARPVPEWKDAKIALEKWMLTNALIETQGNMAAAARRLGITKVAVLHAVRRHSLEDLKK